MTLHSSSTNAHAHAHAPPHTHHRTRTTAHAPPHTHHRTRTIRKEKKKKKKEESAHALASVLWGVGGQDDGAGDAESLRGDGHAEAVVAAAGGEDPRGQPAVVPVAVGQERVGGAAELEAAALVQTLELEPHRPAHGLGQPPAVLDRRRPHQHVGRPRNIFFLEALCVERLLIARQGGCRRWFILASRGGR